jgi:CBS-domain-containing membrane protein
MNDTPRQNAPRGAAPGFLARLLARHEPRANLPQTLKAGLFAGLAILGLGLMFDATGLPLLIGPFGASTILLFGRPNGVLAQPANVVGGYLIAACVAFVAAEFFPGVLWATAFSTGLSLILMASVRLTHPPAGAIPLIVFGDEAEVINLVVAIVVGSLVLVAMAIVVHRIPPRRGYPLDDPVDE